MVFRLKSLSIIIIIGLISYPFFAKADIYKYTDDEGVIHLTNVPTQINSRYILMMKEKRILLKIKDISKYDDLITEVSKKYNVDSALIKAIIKAESNFNHEAVSTVGARGLMQLMPKTASYLQVDDSFHPGKNIDGGVRYLRYLLNLFDNNLPLALAAYNAGENAVARYNYNIPPYPETRNYVRRVLNYLNSYSNNK
jgi:soluble lytic murein transglycosylase-like protein